jgi:hypothetical protein
MKTMIVTLLLFAASIAEAEVKVNINVNADIPVRVAPVPPQPFITPVPAAVPSFVFQVAPDFLEPTDLGFFVAIGVPYDMYYIGNAYYIFHNKVWYRARSYNGPWEFVDYGTLPSSLDKYRESVVRVRVIRDRDYKEYQRDHTRYSGRHFKPDKEVKEEKKHEKEEWKENKRREKEERKKNKHRKHDDDDD